MTKAYKYTSLQGFPIVGIVERVEGIANINGINKDGTPVYAGETSIDWDSQRSDLVDGRRIYVDSQGFRYTFEELVPVIDEPFIDTSVTQRELDTVIAALRYWQHALDKDLPASLVTSRDQLNHIYEIATNDRKGDDAALLPNEIDNLIMRINT